MKSIKTNAFISLLGLTLFTTIVILLHFLRPDKNIHSSFVSEFAVGKYSWLMTIAFDALSFSTVLLLINLILQVRSSLTGKITLGTFCVGILIAALFPTDVPPFPQTTVGLIHGFAALIALLNLGISMIVWGISFKKNNDLKKLAESSVFCGIISLILLILFIASPISLRGLTQRILLTCNISWLYLVNLNMYRSARA